ncbi:Uncharacterized protein pbN1_20780 [Aromatoleum bremense]|nr:Uncharacterized protein pbN1_20780 [Aromatoleum bremense]
MRAGLPSAYQPATGSGLVEFPESVVCRPASLGVWAASFWTCASPPRMWRLVVMVAPPYARMSASAARRSPTRHAVTRSESFTGAGRVPALARRHAVAGEQAKRPQTTGRRTCAASGSASKFWSAPGTCARGAAGLPAVEVLRVLRVRGCRRSGSGSGSPPPSSSLAASGAVGTAVFPPTFSPPVRLVSLRM